MRRSFDGKTWIELLQLPPKRSKQGRPPAITKRPLSKTLVLAAAASFPDQWPHFHHPWHLHRLQPRPRHQTPIGFGVSSEYVSGECSQAILPLSGTSSLAFLAETHFFLTFHTVCR